MRWLIPLLFLPLPALAQEVDLELVLLADASFWTPAQAAFLREEILAVVRKYVQVPDSAVNIQLQREDGLEVLEMNIYNGKTVSRGKVPVPYANVLAGVDGAPRVVTGTNEKNEREVYIRATDSNDWVELPQQQFGTTFSPIAVTKDNKSLYVFDNKGQDKTGIFKLNLTDGSYENIYTDPVVDVSSVNTTADQRSEIKLPSESNGMVMVFRTFDRVSYALILDVRMPVRVGDRLVNPD